MYPYVKKRWIHYNRLYFYLGLIDLDKEGHGGLLQAGDIY